MRTVVDLYYKTTGQKPKRPEPARVRLFSGRRTRLHEGVQDDAIEAYNEVWLSAVEFFTKERDELIDLPPESSERMFVEGVLGILRQHELDRGNTSINNDDVRAEAMRIASSLGDIREGASTDLRAYVDRLISGMRELHNRIDPAGVEDELAGDDMELGGEEPPEEPLSDDGGETPDGGAKGKEKEGEDEEAPPEPEQPEKLAKSLGLGQ